MVVSLEIHSFICSWKTIPTMVPELMEISHLFWYLSDRKNQTIMSQSIPTGYIPPGSPWGLAQKIAQGVGIWLLKVAPGPEFDKGRDSAYE